MKKNKLLISVFSGLSLAPAVSCMVGCSCNKKSDSENIAEAIIKPSESKQTTKLTDKTFTQALSELSDSDRKNEMFYDLFIYFTLTGRYKLQSTDSFATLYRNNVVSCKTNVTKSTLNFGSDKKLYCNFLGYVSFVFLKDYEGIDVNYKTDDYVMLTFDINSQPVEIVESNCSLKYSVTDTKFENPCIGFAKIRYAGGREVMQDIKTIDTGDAIIKNSHNWTK